MNGKGGIRSRINCGIKFRKLVYPEQNRSYPDSFMDIIQPAWIFELGIIRIARGAVGTTFHVYKLILIVIS